jgi:hypothetical protein
MWRSEQVRNLRQPFDRHTRGSRHRVVFDAVVPWKREVEHFGQQSAHRQYRSWRVAPFRIANRIEQLLYVLARHVPNRNMSEYRQDILVENPLVTLPRFLRRPRVQVHVIDGQITDDS